MTRLILLFAILLSMSASGSTTSDLSKKSEAFAKQSQALGTMSESLRDDVDRFAATLASGNCEKVAMGLIMLAGHRATAVDSKVENLKYYNMSRGILQEEVKRIAGYMNTLIATAKGVGLVAELRDCRKLLQETQELLRTANL